MKKIINDIIVVEGKSDACLLSSFIDGEIITTNGLDCNKETLEYLKLASKFKKILILTDPDDAGLTIRQKIKENVNNVFVISANIDYCNKHNKHGIAESSKKYLNDLLCKYYSNTKIQKFIDKHDVNSLVHDYKINKNDICKAYNIGSVSLKTITTRLNTLQITKNMVLGKFNYEN